MARDWTKIGHRYNVHSKRLKMTDVKSSQRMIYLQRFKNAGQNTWACIKCKFTCFYGFEICALLMVIDPNFQSASNWFKFSQSLWFAITIPQSVCYSRSLQWYGSYRRNTAQNELSRYNSSQYSCQTGLLQEVARKVNLWTGKTSRRCFYIYEKQLSWKFQLIPVFGSCDTRASHCGFAFKFWF